jgi:hypothetical protein
MTSYIIIKVGQAYELNNQKLHSVVNEGTEDRITFIFDYVPAVVLRALVESSRDQGPEEKVLRPY